MLDSPSLRIAVRRNPPTVEDLRSTTVSDDPVQRRDLILIERARSGDLDAFNDLVILYQDSLFALVVRMVPDRDQAAMRVLEGRFSSSSFLAVSMPATGSPFASSKPICTSTLAWSQ